ncbi:helix-turn-helix transcriptional regulator [Bacillus piscicola]|uniref:helix-turn-helix transcriptional regulator n=1 Tax=Bacillus piscicola TaxID=1632684 RepID=UPI001F097764|nr:helix-turn-helix domain-containing protein [Bacillus piscicola]
MNLTTFGKRLRKVRVEKGYSQLELAELMNHEISNVRLSQFERDKNHPKADEITTICNALGVDANTLFGHNQEVESLENLYKDQDFHVFQERLFSTRVKKDISRRKLSKRSGVPVEEIKRLEVEDVNEIPAAKTLFDLAASLGVTPDYLSGYVDQEDEFSSRTPQTADLEEFLEKNLTVYRGMPLTVEDIDRLKKILSSLFFEAYERDLLDKERQEDEENLEDS